MAKKTENESTANAETTPDILETTPELAPEGAAVVTEAVTQPGNEEADKAEPVEPASNAPQSLAALAARYRVPAWQAAALNRFMGWADDKMVSEADFVVALHSLDARRLGGGRG